VVICTIKRGFSLVELLVTLGIISVLLGLTMPAVQQARESARRTACLNNLRQLGLASQGFLVTKSYFPGPVVNAWPGTTSYTKDAGFLFELLPYLEQSPLHGQFDRQSYLHSMANRDQLTRRVSTLYCPSAGDPSVLTNIASGVSGAAVEGLDSLTCDYSGSGGVWDFSMRFDGSNGGIVALRIGNQSGTRIGEVRDGLSNTLLAWESCGDGLYLPESNFRQPINSGAPDEFVCRARAGNFQSNGRPACLTYLYSWAGFRTGSLSGWNPAGIQVNPRDGKGQSINQTNRYGEPFSRHPAGSTFVLADGSVAFFSAEFDSAVLSDFVSFADGRIVAQ
jgi:prepilin-type N-terminal cleavage/methylation domain-containing protein